LKRSLDQLYVAMSLGERAAILAQIQQIVPQFTYADGDQAESTEKMPLSPGASQHVHEAQREREAIAPHLREEPALVDMPRSPHRTWQVSPSLGPVRGVPGD
jgi:hypothetical protein